MRGVLISFIRWSLGGASGGTKMRLRQCAAWRRTNASEAAIIRKQLSLKKFKEMKERTSKIWTNDSASFSRWASSATGRLKKRWPSTAASPCFYSTRRWTKRTTTTVDSFISSTWDWPTAITSSITTVSSGKWRRVLVPFTGMLATTKAA